MHGFRPAILKTDVQRGVAAAVVLPLESAWPRKHYFKHHTVWHLGKDGDVKERVTIIIFSFNPPTLRGCATSSATPLAMHRNVQGSAGVLEGKV